MGYVAKTGKLTLIWLKEINVLNNKRSAMIFVAAGLFALSLSGCQKEEGPAEKAGKEIDKAMGQAGQQIQKAGDSIQQAAKDARK